MKPQAVKSSGPRLTKARIEYLRQLFPNDHRSFRVLNELAQLDHASPVSGDSAGLDSRSSPQPIAESHDHPGRDSLADVLIRGLFHRSKPVETTSPRNESKQIADRSNELHLFVSTVFACLQAITRYVFFGDRTILAARAVLTRRADQPSIQPPVHKGGLS